MMTSRRRDSGAATWVVAAGIAIVGVSASPIAQSAGSGDRSALLREWTLNRELSAAQPALDPGNRPQSRGGRRGGVTGGMGGRRGFPGGGSRGGGSEADREAQREAMEQMRALVQEVMVPPTRWTIARNDAGALVFTDASGRSMKFVPDDKTEKHQFTSGTVETKTRWERDTLRQEITVPGGARLTRTFSVTPEAGQMVVTTTASGGRGGQQPAVRWVYDGDPR